MKVKKDTMLYDAISEGQMNDWGVIGYIKKWLAISPHAGVYEVDDRPYKSRSASRKRMHFHPSSDCMKCERQLYFERDDSTPLPPDNIDSGLQAIFKTGSAMHSMVQAWFGAMSTLDGFPVLVEAERRIEGGCFEGYGVGGYIDAVVRLPGSDADIPVEIKTCNDRVFSTLSSPKPEHKMQLGCYLAWMGAPYGIVLYINKNTSEMKEFKVEPTDLSNILIRWSNVRRALDSGSPEGLSFGCTEGSRDWERCPFAGTCFKSE